MEKVKNYHQHQKILGILFIVFSLLNLVFFTGIVTFISTILPFTDAPEEAIMIFGAVKYAVIALFLLFSIPCLIVGIGLISQKKWAMTGALILGIMSLPIFPIWTCIGVYSIVLYFTMQRDQSKSFNSTEYK